MPRKTADDIGFDELGRTVAIGDAAAKIQQDIFEHPDSQPLLMVAMLGDNLAMRTFGPPSEEMADLLDRLAYDYRKALTLTHQSDAKPA